MMPEWLGQVVAIVAAGVGVYAAIRADLAALRVKAEMAVERADYAHRRIDGLFQHKGG